MGISSKDLIVELLDYFASLRNKNIKMDGYTIDLLMLECYEHIFGIVDLNDVNEPLAVIRYTNADTLGDLGSISELIKQYRTSEIGDKYGMSITEYFNTPINVAKLLMSNARVEKQDMDDIVNSAANDAKDELQKKKRKNNR